MKFIFFVLIILILFVGQVQAYDCGPNLQAYAVYTTSGAKAHGVRCLKKRGRSFIWYGEGFWGETIYRHVGKIIYNNSKFNAYMSDIFGNGEDTAGDFAGNIQVTMERFDLYPQWIKLSGAINEEWRMVDHNDYFSVVSAQVKNCGPNFNQYQVTGLTGPIINGEGVRCVMKRKVGDSVVWYGQGSWDDALYAHLGEIVNVKYGYAYDICNYRYDICNSKEARLSVDHNSNYYLIKGDWTEKWVK